MIKHLVAAIAVALLAGPVWAEEDTVYITHGVPSVTVYTPAGPADISRIPDPENEL